MANTYGRMRGGNRPGETRGVTRTGSRYITAELLSHVHRADVDMWADGRVDLKLSTADGERIALVSLYPADDVLTGNDGRPVLYIDSAGAQDH